ncbi:MAG: UvrD-helicase domain-containing protein [Deltaproteobacteria bacterium]|nr:UvrD-helicase domain-containing protein [Deltaproteobacteria bacterium]
MSEHDLHQSPIGNSLWRAGAGAGKTYNLVERVLRIEHEWRKKPENQGRSPRLVVTTFTRMATQELRMRLMEAALKSDRQVELIPFVTSRSQLFVTTMHGVMDSFLRTFGSEIGLEPGYRVASPDELDTLIRRVGKRVFFPDNVGADVADADPSIDIILGEFSFSAALSLMNRISKTRREFQFSDRPARPAEKVDFELALRRCLAERAQAISELINEIEEKQPSDKWNDFLDWLNRGLSILRLPSAGSFTEQLNALLEWNESAPKFQNARANKIEFLAGEKWKDPIKFLNQEVENAIQDLAAIEKFVSLNLSLSAVEARFTEEIRSEKFRSGLIELEDLELLSIELIQKSPQSARSFADSWDHWLIDEFQDTSPRQVQLIEALSSGKPQFIVGDPQQSIYLFRGARPGVFSEREAMALARGDERTELMGNRRSSPGVMKFLNYTVQRLEGEFQEMTSVRATQDRNGRKPGSIESPLGAASVLLLPPATMANAKGEQKPLKVDELRRLEAARLAKAAKQLLASGASPASIAVLGRSNRELTVVAREFAKAGLQFQIHTAGAYSDRLETADLCALLGFLSNPHDDENLIHLARTAWFPIEEETLALGYRRDNSLWNTIESATLSDEEDVMVQALRAALQAVRERGVVQAFRETLSSCDFFSWCGVLDPSGRREANVLKFISKLSVAERQAGFLPRKFCDEVMGGGDRGGESESNDRDAVAAIKPDRIHLMTIHVSKGLEFDHVFLPFLSDSAKKSSSRDSKFVFHEVDRVWTAAVSVDDEGGYSAGPIMRDWSNTMTKWSLEEQRRLLYVAVTRARESLLLTATVDVEEEVRPESFLGFLRFDLSPGDHGSYTVLTEANLLPRAGQSEVEAPPEVELRLPWLRSREPVESAKLISMSVSRLLELESEAARSPGNPAPLRGEQSADAFKALKMADAAARGTRLHRVFEMAKSDSKMNRDLMAREIARWFPEKDQENASSALRWVLELKAPDIASILASGEVEWSFTYKSEIPSILQEKLGGPTGRLAIEGQIDLWGRDSSGQLWVLDYKTGSSQYADKALRQLEYYAAALVAGGIAEKTETIQLAALFPFSKEVFTKSTSN